VSDSVVIERIDAFCDVVPRERTRAETFGSLVLFVPVGSGFPYYARPGLGARRPVTAADVRAVRARQRELLIPESFEWIERTAPEMASAATEAGLVVHAHPLLALGSLAPAPRVPELVDVRIVSPEDPDLILAWAVPGVAFGHPGTDIGEAGVTERDKIAANHDAATIEMLRSRLRSRRSVLATASGPNGPLAAGSYQLAEGTAEITGIGVLPASRRRGLAAAVTRALAADALARGARTVFLSATDAAVARIYARLGFREIGTSLIAELPEDLLVRGGAKQRTISASCPRIDSFAEGRSNGPYRRAARGLTRSRRGEATDRSLPW
jgi:ribosomal protein S18 acetylase RimI-like enzyme